MTSNGLKVLSQIIWRFCCPIFYVFTFLVPYCIFRYDFRIETMFGSSLFTVICIRTEVLFILFVFVENGGVQHALTVYMSNMTDVL